MEKIEVLQYEVLGRLPSVLTLDNGTRVRDAETWKARRQEIYKTAVELQYGTLPPAPEVFDTEVLYKGHESMSCRITCGTRQKQLSFTVKIMLPAGEKHPVIIDGDTSFNYYLSDGFAETALKRNIGLVLFNRVELAHDVRGKERSGGLYDVYPEYTFGALGAWAWGYSRCIDALEALGLPGADMDLIAFTGHSRGGKTAALAGAVDTRCAVVNPNETCAGSSACYRVHMEGRCGSIQGRSETLADLWKNFSFWLGPEMEKYKDDETLLPFDCHFLKAMIAPRTAFYSEAAADFWANPVGAYQTTRATEEVYRLLGAEEELLWYYRPGTHGHTVGDLEMLCEIILHKKDPSHPLPAGLFEAPFDIPEPIW